MSLQSFTVCVSDNIYNYNIYIYILIVLKILQNSISNGIPTPLKKYESQIGPSSQILGKIIQIFQTTNQIYIYLKSVSSLHLNPPKVQGFFWGSGTSRQVPQFSELYFRPIRVAGCIPTPLKIMKVGWDDYSQYMEK